MTFRPTPDQMIRVNYSECPCLLSILLVICLLVDAGKTGAQTCRQWDQKRGKGALGSV
jgi:hypothetical protein